MTQIKTLAPTILHAIKAVEEGCRKIQDDPNFIFDMGCLMVTKASTCYGCLSTTTLLYLTNKTTADIIKSGFRDYKQSSQDRRNKAYALGIEEDADKKDILDLVEFEKCINSFGQRDLKPLLLYYGMDNHKNAAKALTWLSDYPNYSYPNLYLENDDLLPYADQLKYLILPNLEEWLAPDK